MAQLTIYIDDETLGKISQQARREHDSVSAWVKKRLTHSLVNDWPNGYFENLGLLGKTDFVRPPQPDPRSDPKRQAL